MPVIEIKKDPSRKDLLVFGLLFGLFTLLVGLLAYYQYEAPRAARAIWATGAAITGLHFLIPPLRRPIYFGWSYAVYPIGWTISHLLLATIYYIVLTPIGLLIRLLAKDPIEKKPDKMRSSYWVERSGQGDPSRYFRQF